MSAWPRVKALLARAARWWRAWRARAVLVVPMSPETLRVLGRSARRAGIPLAELARTILEREVTAESIALAATEEATEAAWGAVRAAADRADEMEEMLARCEAGEFTAEQWRGICAKYSA